MLLFQIVLQPSVADASLANTGSETGPVVSSVGVGFAIVIGVILFASAVAMLIRKLSRPELDGLSPEKIKQIWKQILHASQQGVLGRKMAVIEADKLLDNVLKSMMIPGETLGERLKMAAYKYPKIRDIWSAHKLRNQLVHESSFELSGREASRAIHDYEKCLKMLNVL